MISGTTLALLRDTRDLLWLVLDDFERRGDDTWFTVHFLARDEPEQPPRPFLSAGPYREPIEGLDALARALGEAVSGELHAMRHDPINDGLSLELKSKGEGARREYEVVLWLDLTGMGPALRARGSRGRQQAGLRLFVDRAGLEAFRAGLVDHAFST